MLGLPVLSNPLGFPMGVYHIVSFTVIFVSFCMIYLFF